MKVIPNSVAEHYCNLHGISPENFVRHVLPKVLHPHARLIVPVLLVFKNDYLAADNDFIVAVGQITHYREFSATVAEFFYHPANQRILRQRFLVRVSSERMRRLVKEMLGLIHSEKEATQKTNFPFAVEVEEQSDPASLRQNS